MCIVENYLISLLDVDNLEDCLEVFQILIDLTKHYWSQYKLCVSYLLDCIKNE